jgi:hypothetical protein
MKNPFPAIHMGWMNCLPPINEPGQAEHILIANPDIHVVSNGSGITG